MIDDLKSWFEDDLSSSNESEGIKGFFKIVLYIFLFPIYFPIIVILYILTSIWFLLTSFFD